MYVNVQMPPHSFSTVHLRVVFLSNGLPDELKPTKECTMSEKRDEKKISEALDLLEEMAKSNKAELQAMVSNGYSNLEELLAAFANELETQAKETYEEGKDKVIGLATSINKMVHKNPWPYIGGVAVGMLILGLFQGRSKK